LNRILLLVTGDATRGLIDTNIVGYLAALDPALLRDEMAISAITLAELSAGPHHTADPAGRSKRNSVLQHAEATFDPLPFDAESARTYGMICAAVLAVGRTPRRGPDDRLHRSHQPASALHHQPSRLCRTGSAGQGRGRTAAAGQRK
jgi:predicted nucleic acid-binding protein